MEFERAIKKNEKVQRLEKAIRKTGDMADLYKFANAVGDVAMDVITANVSDSGGLVDEGYVRSIVAPVLRAGHAYIAVVACEAINLMYGKSGLGLKAVSPEYDTERENEVIQSIVEKYNESIGKDESDSKADN